MLLELSGLFLTEFSFDIYHSCRSIGGNVPVFVSVIPFEFYCEFLACLGLLIVVVGGGCCGLLWALGLRFLVVFWSFFRRLDIFFR